MSTPDDYYDAAMDYIAEDEERREWEEKMDQEAERDWEEMERREEEWNAEAVRHLARHDPVLVQVFRDLGAAFDASGCTFELGGACRSVLTDVVISEYDGRETLLYDIDRHKADEKAALHRFFLEEIQALLATHQSDREKLDGIQEILWSDHVYESPDSRESDGMKKMKRAKMGT